MVNCTECLDCLECQTCPEQQSMFSILTVCKVLFYPTSLTMLVLKRPDKLPWTVIAIFFF